jgi:hypothetical protein
MSSTARTPVRNGSIGAKKFSFVIVNLLRTTEDCEALRGTVV